MASRTVASPRPEQPSRPAQEDESSTRPLGEPPPPLRPVEGTALLGSPPPTDRLRGWLVTIVLGMVAVAVRFAGLGHPTDGGTPVFDEKHYAPQAWQILRNGGFEDNPGFELVVHPPLGKQLIALGELLFGYNGFGWRAAAALAGVLTVVLVVRVARRLTRSTLLGAVAGILLICDGLSHVQSRMGMLDAFLAFTVVAAFATLVRDRDDVRARLAVVMAEGRIGDSPYGPWLGARWWRLATGVLLGLGCGVKWSGVYWLAAFAVLLLLWDLTARRAAGVERPLKATIVRDLAPALWALLLVPLLTYLATWWGWLGSETGVDRHAVNETTGIPGPLWIPDALRGLWYNGGKVLEFHASLVTQPSKPHPWESKPFAWPMGLRPMLYYYAGEDQVTGCGSSKCVAAVMLVGTPALWWPSLLVIAFGLWRVVARFDWRHAAVLVGYGAGFLPWLINLDRQMYFFYMTPVVPFLVLATVLLMGDVLGRAGASTERRQTGLLVVGLWVGAVVANFIWLWPILVGQTITLDMWNAQLWLPSWSANTATPPPT